MTQSSDDDFDWTLRSGSTPSSDTGPDSGVGGYGYYIYIEASDPRRLNDKAMILLPSFTRDGDFCLSFSFNMYGYHVNMLRVAKLVASGQLVTLWKMKGQQGPHWQTAQFNVDLRTADQLAFIGIRGEAFSGDIAVDSIAVRSGRCVDGEKNVGPH
ncbi:hypothetical protein NP493_756g00046 [Ridgeia piscesae]|uniref:MAM domain-containing protein n=1 Tax=Ridgeia piscesae TaxID=27915 RepID=A0AAD9KPG3_RIDPI|nr:hypothetical protein NP493_756g00046 [Ridgeia piscesae]